MINLLRDTGVWDGVERALIDADDGAVILIDGDLQPDWRIPSTFLAGLLDRARARGVNLVGVTKHSSLSRGGAPLIGHLEREAETLFGPRAMWWAPVARTRPDVSSAIQVVVAKLDPDAPFAFRIDVPGDVDPEPLLASISALCDDAAFPGYPYPLTVADRCDSCGAQAFIRAVFMSGELTFCGHHGRENLAALESQAVFVEDSTELINAKPSPSAVPANRD